MPNKNIFHQLFNFASLVTLLYITGMLGVVVTSIYHIFFETYQVGITPTIILATVFLIFILIAVIIAKFSKNTKKDSDNTFIIASFSIAIVFILFVLSSINR